jgi:dienelactone hydrolase
MNKKTSVLLLAVIALALSAARASAAAAKGVEPEFDVSDPGGSLFPSDLFTVPDASQLTGLRVNLPKPDCTVQPSDCNDIAVLNTLDGFNLQPRLSIPFTGPIDLSTVSNDSVFLFALGPTPRFVGINQVVWDPETTTLYAESDQALDQDARYLLVVTDKVHDTSGDPIDTTQFRKFLNYGQTKDDADKAYRDELLAALDQLEAAGVPTDSVADASIFTTESATAVMEKIRDQVAAKTPDPADFQLGTNGERTVFPFADVSGITFRRQVLVDPTQPNSFTTGSLALGSTGLYGLPGTTGTVGTIAFGKYRSPDYENADGVIPAVGTLTGTPAVQSTNDVYFNLFLPAGPEPTGGWPVVIAGHGAGGNKDTGNTPIHVAAKLAQHGLATITINAVGHGGGPLGTLTVSKTDGTTVTLSSGGRGIDVNGDHKIATTGIGEGLLTAPNGPDAIVLARDGLRQTVVDLMQLAREIQAGIDVNGDGSPDLDPSRIYYFGNSLGGIYGTDFVALEPAVRAGVLVGDRRIDRRGRTTELRRALPRTSGPVTRGTGPDSIAHQPSSRLARPDQSRQHAVPIQREPPTTEPSTTREHHSGRDRNPERDRPDRVGGAGLRPGRLRPPPAHRAACGHVRKARAPHLRPGRPGRPQPDDSQPPSRGRSRRPDDLLPRPRRIRRHAASADPGADRPARVPVHLHPGGNRVRRRRPGNGRHLPRLRRTSDARPQHPATPRAAVLRNPVHRPTALKPPTGGGGVRPAPPPILFTSSSVHPRCSAPTLETGNELSVRQHAQRLAPPDCGRHGQCRVRVSWLIL